MGDPVTAGVAAASAPELMTALEGMAAGGASEGALGSGIVAATQADPSGFLSLAGGMPGDSSNAFLDALVSKGGGPGPATQWAMVLNQLKGLVPQGNQMASSGPPPLHASIPAPNLLGPAPNAPPLQTAMMGGVGGGGQGLQQLLAMLQRMGGR